jgi:hypothetical protein
MVRRETIYWGSMRRLASFVAILLLLTAVAPVLACVTGRAMSREESACCQSMHGQCGNMAKMGCCRTEVRTDETPQIPAAFPATDVQWVVVAQLAPGVSPIQSMAATWLQTPEDYFPPGLLTAKITVLRI